MTTLLASDPQVTPDAAAPVRADGVSIDRVTVSYDGVDAVVDASLEVPAGSTLALLGPSGCGKTSLLRAIAGLERPTAGRIDVGSTTMSSVRDRIWVKPERRHVGMVFQDGALFPHLTVAQNIAFGLRNRRGAKARVAELLDLVDLTGLGDRLPETLSGGQQQRVALARSLAPNPSVLLLDEPFSALDAQLRTQVRAEVVRILREVGVTTVFVTHDQDEAFVVGDRVAVMRDGRIEQTGTPDGVYLEPVSPWVAAFVGEANLLPGRRTGRAAVTVLGTLPIREVADVTDVPDGSDDDADVDDADVMVLVRPEQLALSDGDAGTVTSVEYYGHDVRYAIELAGGPQVAVRRGPERLRAVGDRVDVEFVGDHAETWRL